MNFVTDGVELRMLTLLLKEYSQLRKELMPPDYIERRIIEQPRKIAEPIAAKFLRLMKHEEFINKIVDSFWNTYKLNPTSREYTMALVYFVIFELETENEANTFEGFCKCNNYGYCLSVLNYFTLEENLVGITQSACKIYEDDYVLENILEPLTKKLPLLKQLCEHIACKEMEAAGRRTPKPPTQPIEPSFMSRVRRAPPPPVCTPIFETSRFKSKPFRMPDVIHVVDRPVRKVTSEKQSPATIKPFALTDRSYSKTRQEQGTSNVEVINTPKFKAKAVPLKQNVIIKTTAATVLREGAVLSKQQEKELNMLSSILSGAFDPSKISDLDNRARYTNEQENIREIERKHLMGMLSYEEAILAKKKLLEKNKHKMALFKKEREQILEEIGKWREREQIKMKSFIEKGQNIAKGARESAQKLILERQQQAKLTTYENKKLLSEALKAREEELDRKAKLIQELRMLHEIHKMEMQNKEFDRTECPNFGFLCEMSIAELQERLGLLKMQMQMELQERQEAIVKGRERRQKFVQETEDFVRQIRLCKMKPQPQNVSLVKPQSVPELDALRNRLQLVKNQRLGMAQSQNAF